MDGNILHGSYDVHENEDSSSDCESTTSTVRLDRKKRKPLMEKKRRARINASLEQLKKLVLDAMKKDSARYSKLEKADILELTVRHLREGQQQSMNVAMAQDVSVAPKFKAGFAECASEVGRYLSSIDGLNHNVSARLMQHLSHYVQRIEHCTLTTASNATTTTTSSKMYHHHNNNQYHHRVQQQQQQQQQGGYRSSTVNPSNIRVVSEANLHQPHTNPHPMYNPSTGKPGSAVSCSVQPLQIHIPSAAPSLLLPGFRSSISEHLSGSGSGSVMRTSPEPGNLPPTPPSSAENSFNGNFNFIPVSVSESLQAQYPYNVHNRRDFAPLKAKENIAALSNNISKQKQLHSVINNNHVKFSPASVRGNIKNEIKQSVKQEDMWRPW